MARSIPKDFIDRLVEDSDIVSVINHYISLSKKGNNYTCCCPFHEEKTPSFVVSPQKAIFHCFGCGAGGNVLTFIKDYEYHLLRNKLRSPILNEKCFFPST